MVSLFCWKKLQRTLITANNLIVSQASCVCVCVCMCGFAVVLAVFLLVQWYDITFLLLCNIKHYLFSVVCLPVTFVCPFDWYQNLWPWMTLNGIMAVTLRNFNEFGKPVLQKTICGGIYTYLYIFVFLMRVQCRRKESSRSLSHLLMSFLLYVCIQLSVCRPCHWCRYEITKHLVKIRRPLSGVQIWLQTGMISKI